MAETLYPHIPKIYFDVLQIVNEKVAAAFKSTAKEVQFEFVSFIPCEQKNKVALGRIFLNVTPPQVKLVLRPGWPNTAVHEIVHLYDPYASENKVEALSLQVAKYLKAWS